MEFMKNILEKAAITDGKLDIDGVMSQIDKELPKHLVSKTDYDAKVKELNAANTTITTLKKENEGNEELQKTIKTHETTITNLQREKANIKKQYALRSAIEKTGCTDAEYLIYKHGGLDKFNFDKDGNPVGVEETVKPYKESLKALFPTGGIFQEYKPGGGTGGNVVNPFDKKTWNMTEQGKLFKENPEQARAMAASAGLTI